MSATIGDWVFVAGGGSLAVIGAALLGWALFRDRSRGRRRCSRCWYDMAGVPGLRCPECGREARSERGLLRTRRRWRGACGAVVVLGAGYGTWCVPGVRAAGWASIVPSAVLVFIAPPGLGNVAQARLNGSGGNPPVLTRLMRFQSGATQAGPARAIEDTLTDAAWSRLDQGRLARWESQVFVSRVIKHQKISLASWFRVPARWPVDEPFPFWITSSGLPLELKILGPPPAGAWTTHARWPGGPVELDVCLLNRSKPVYFGTVTAPIIVAGTADTFLGKVGSAADNALACRALRPRLIRLENGRLAVMVNDRGPTPVWEQVGFLLHYRVDVEVDGVVVGSARGTAEWKWPVWKDWEELAIDWVGDGETRGLGAAEELARGESTTGSRIRLVMRGDTVGAARLYMSVIRGKDHLEPGTKAALRVPPATCWAGEFVVPVTKIEKGMVDR